MSGLARKALRPLPLLAACALATVAVLAPSSPSVPAGDQPAEAAELRPAARFALDGRRGTTVLRHRRYLGDGPTLDVYRRAGIRAAVPAVLVVHGGGWAGGGKRRMAPVAQAIARSGMVAVNVSYTLADWGRPGYPVQPDQLSAAVGWVRRHAARLGVDRDRIGAFGSSAGGHLAALLATSAHGRWGEPPIDAAVLWSAPLDLAPLAGHRMLGPAAELLVGCPLAACPQLWSEASPLAAVSPGDAPLLLVNSRRELVPVDQPLRMAERLAAAGVPHELWLLEGSAHAREYMHRTLRRSVEFLKEWLD